jgi:uncharacterized protein
MKIAIAGATGFVGRRLVERLQDEGHSVVVLTRNADRATPLFPKSEIIAYDQPDWQNALSGCDGVVNLAGEPIAEQRWTPAQKQLLIDSRVNTTEQIVAAINQASPAPPVLVNASAIGYYGTSETAEFDETSGPGADFLAEICQKWEAAAAATSSRLVILRLGVVLGSGGGALGKMLPAFRAFAGGPIGKGNQWFSWIHRDDVVSLILRALSDGGMQGVYNATAPAPVRMSGLCEAIGATMKRPSWLPVPGFVLEAMLGEGAKVVLEGQRVLPKRPIGAGFGFAYPDIQAALGEILD